MNFWVFILTHNIRKCAIINGVGNGGRQYGVTKIEDLKTKHLLHSQHRSHKLVALVTSSSQ